MFGIDAPFLYKSNGGSRVIIGWVVLFLGGPEVMGRLGENINKEWLSVSDKSFSCGMRVVDEWERDVDRIRALWTIQTLHVRDGDDE